MGVHTIAPHRHPARRLAVWLGRLLALAVAVLVAGAATILVALPRLADAQALTVLSGSMTPGIPVGSVVLVRPVDPADLRVGDIATYQAEPGKPVYITHRIVAVDTDRGRTTFTFKGDANRGADAKPVVPGQVRGELWFHVPYLGSVRDRLHSTGVRLLVLCVLLGGYAVTQLVAGVRERSVVKPAEEGPDDDRQEVDRVTT